MESPKDRNEQATYQLLGWPELEAALLVFPLVDVPVVAVLLVVVAASATLHMLRNQVAMEAKSDVSEQTLGSQTLVETLEKGTSWP